MKAWPPPWNWASQAPGMALTMIKALEAGMTMSSAPVATSAGARSLRSRVGAAIAVPRVHRDGLPMNEVGRQPRARGCHDVAELEVDGLSEIAGKQQEEQSPSLLVRAARHVGQLRLHGG